MAILLGLCEAGVPSSAATTMLLPSRMGGNAPKLLGIFKNWGDVPLASEYTNAAAIGAGVVLCLQPMTVPGGVRTAIDMPALLTGGHDTYLGQVAAVLAAAPCPVYLRFMHEMNLVNLYPWDTGTRTAADQIAYYRYVTTFFRAHAPNVKHIWCVNSDPTDDPTHRLPFTHLYPGDAYCDFTGFDWYNYAGLKGSGWHEFTFPITDTYTPLAAFGKPIFICETNSHYTGGDKAQWLLTGFLSTIPTLMPLVAGVCLFSFDRSTSGEIDWRWDTTVAGPFQQAWIRIANDPIYGGRLPRYSGGLGPHAGAFGPA